MTRRAGWSVLLILALVPAISYLFRDGYFASSDGMIHLYRLFELDRSMHDGVLFPRWFPLSGYGYGLPVLNYYPPLTYYLAEIFHLAGAGYIVAIKELIALNVLIAAFSMWMFARDLLGEGAAFVAGIALAYSPYLLSDAYVRGNFPEMLAMSLIPLALWAFRRVYDARDHAKRLRPSIWLAAVAFTAIILAHHLTAMQFAALLLAYVAFLFLARRDGRSLVAYGAAILVGLALSAFYWVPSLAELNLALVGPESVARFLVSRLIPVGDFFAPSLAYLYVPQNEALKHAFGFPQTMLALLVGVGALVLVARRVRQADRHWQHAGFFFALVGASIFMTLTPSAPLWNAIPTLRFMQFPWRFQILASIGVAFLIGVGVNGVVKILPRSKAITYPAFSLALIALALANLPLRDFPLTDTQVDLTRASDPDYVVAQMGWGWTREFVPADVREFDAIYAPIQSRGTEAAPPPAPTQVEIERAGLLAQTLRVSTAHAFELSLHTFFFPGWQAYVDGAPARTYPRGSLALATVTIPAGDHVIAFRFEDTPLRAAMNLVSLIALAGAAMWLLIARRRVFGALLVALIVLAAMLAWHVREPRAQPVAAAATLEQKARLIGHIVESDSAAVYVTLHWLALSNMDRDYFSFVHLLDADGNVIAQHDGPTDQGLTPTTRWLPGEWVADRHAISLRDVAPGEYRVAAGMYLPLADGFQNLGEQIELRSVRVGK